MSTSTRRIPRRAVLLGAGGLAAAAAGAGIAVVPSSAAASAAQLRTDEALPPPGEDLMREHGLLIRVLLVYRQLAAGFRAGGRIPAGQLHDAALIIHDYIEAFHEALEEGYVFPRLQHAGQLSDTVGTLLLQHARGRELTQLILAGTADRGMAAGSFGERLAGAMEAFVRMYEPHEAREDTVVFPAFRRLLPPAEIVELSQRFADLEHQQFGTGGPTAMVDRVAAIERALGIYDLAQFTPPNITPPSAPG